MQEKYESIKMKEVKWYFTIFHLILDLIIGKPGPRINPSFNPNLGWSFGLAIIQSKQVDCSDQESTIDYNQAKLSDTNGTLGLTLMFDLE